MVLTQPVVNFALILIYHYHPGSTVNGLLNHTPINCHVTSIFRLLQPNELVWMSGAARSILGRVIVYSGCIHYDWIWSAKIFCLCIMSMTALVLLCFNLIICFWSVRDDAHRYHARMSHRECFLDPLRRVW